MRQKATALLRLQHGYDDKLRPAVRQRLVIYCRAPHVQGMLSKSWFVNNPMCLPECPTSSCLDEYPSIAPALQALFPLLTHFPTPNEFHADDAGTQPHATSGKTRHGHLGIAVQGTDLISSRNSWRIWTAAVQHYKHRLRSRPSFRIRKVAGSRCRKVICATRSA